MSRSTPSHRPRRSALPLLAALIVGLSALAPNARAADALTTSIPRHREGHTLAASQLCIVIDRVTRSPEHDPDDTFADDLLERAVGQLRRAIEQGFPEPGELTTARVLEPLRGRAAFEELVAEVPSR